MLIIQQATNTQIHANNRTTKTQTKYTKRVKVNLSISCKGLLYYLQSEERERERKRERERERVRQTEIDKQRETHRYCDDW